MTYNKAIAEKIELSNEDVITTSGDETPTPTWTCTWTNLASGSSPCSRTLEKPAQSAFSAHDTF